MLKLKSAHFSDFTDTHVRYLLMKVDDKKTKMESSLQRMNDLVYGMDELRSSEEGRQITLDNLRSVKPELWKGFEEALGGEGFILDPNQI